MFNLKIKYLTDNARIDPPAIEGDAGYDIYSPYEIRVPAHGKIFINSGISMEFPKGYMGRIENKSGVMKKTNLYYAPGIIDAGYRGEIGIIVWNYSDKEEIIPQNTKMCQMCFYQIGSSSIEYTSSLSETPRGNNGFGSTGIK